MKRFTWLLAFALVVPLAGCGSDSKNPTGADPAGAAAEASAGDEALASGDIASANGHYKTALEKDPNNAQANMGAAITEVYLLQNDSDVGGVVDQFPGLVPLRGPAHGPGAERVSRAAFVQSLGLGRHAFDPMANGTMIPRMMVKVAEDPVAVSDVQLVIQNKVLPKLAFAEACFARVETHPDWRFLLLPELTQEPDTLEIDLGEVYALDAIVQTVHGWLGIAVAYDWDGANTEANPESLLAEGTAFGKLHTGAINGAAQLTAARLHFLASALRLNAGIAFIENETDDQSNDIIPQEALADPGFQEFKDRFDLVQASLGGTSVEVPVRTYLDEPYTLDVVLGAFFTNPITDWKTMLPAHEFDDTHEPVVTDPVTFPDPLFHGVFPNMDNDAWRALIGPVNSPPPTIVARR